MMARLQDLRLPQRKGVSSDKTLERMLDRVEALLDEAKAIADRQVPGIPDEVLSLPLDELLEMPIDPLTPIEEIVSLLSRAKEELARYRYPNPPGKNIWKTTEDNVLRAATLRVAGLSWKQIEEDFEYIGIKFTLNDRLRKQIKTAAKRLAPSKKLILAVRKHERRR